MTIPVILPNNSRHFATIDNILQPQKVVISSCESSLHFVFTAAYFGSNIFEL